MDERRYLLKKIIAEILRGIAGKLHSERILF
jgi:hypothetical protein